MYELILIVLFCFNFSLASNFSASNARNYVLRENSYIYTKISFTEILINMKLFFRSNCRSQNYKWIYICEKGNEYMDIYMKMLIKLNILIK